MNKNCKGLPLHILKNTIHLNWQRFHGLHLKMTPIHTNQKPTL